EDIVARRAKIGWESTKAAEHRRPEQCGPRTAHEHAVAEELAPVVHLRRRYDGCGAARPRKGDAEPRARFGLEQPDHHLQAVRVQKVVGIVKLEKPAARERGPV